MFTGCQALDRYERTYSANVDADNKTGYISVTLRPISPIVTQPPIMQGPLDEAYVKALIKLIQEGTKAPDITETPDLKTVKKAE